MHGFPLINTPYYSLLFVSAVVVLIVVAILWTLVLKGFALWHAARGGQKGWFIALLIANTAGILEIVYLIWFRPQAKSPGESAPVVSRTAQE